jgi:hypothetical protein
MYTGLDVAHSPPSSAEDKKAWSYTYTSHVPSRRGVQLSTWITLPSLKLVKGKKKKVKPSL